MEEEVIDPGLLRSLVRDLNKFIAGALAVTTYDSCARPSVENCQEIFELATNTANFGDGQFRYGFGAGRAEITVDGIHVGE